MDLLTGLVAGIGVAAGVQTLMVWRATRAMNRLAAIEARVERFGDALTLLTDTTESAFRAVAAEMARTPDRAERIAPAVSAARTRRIARAATRGASVEQIAAAEEVAEGEVRLRGFGYWPSRIREASVLGAEEGLYLAPEQAAGNVGDTRSDVFALGAVLFETLTGQPLRKDDGPLDLPARLSRARLQGPSTEDDAMPNPIAAILRRALAPDPAARYGEVQEMRKAIDTLLFSGDFTPTTVTPWARASSASLVSSPRA